MSTAIGIGISPATPREGVPGWLSGDAPLLQFDLDAGRYTYRGQSFADFDPWWTAVGGVYARSGNKRYIGADKTLAVAGANVWPTEYDITTGNLIGKSVWGAVATVRGTNRRDLSHADWTKSGTTAAKDQTGIDGVANAASSLTASSDNGTCLQAIADATSRGRGFNPFVKRLAGTGRIEATVDGGTTWIDVSAPIAAAGSEWVRLHIRTSSNIANPSMGFRLGTSGDQIAVDYTQLVDSTSGAPPIAEGETYAGEAPYILLSGIPDFNPFEGTLAAKAFGQSLAITPLNAAGTWIVELTDNTFNNTVFISQAANRQCVATINTGGVQQAGLSTKSGWVTFSYGDSIWGGLRFKANEARFGTEGGMGTADTSVTLPTMTRINIGHSNGGSQLSGAISGLRYYRKWLSDLALPAALMGQRPVVTWGDSLGAGSGASTAAKAWPWRIRRRNPVLSSTLINAVGGTTSAQALAAMQAHATGRDWANIIWTGQNDGSTGAETWANIAAMAALVPRALLIGPIILATDSGSSLTRKNDLMALMAASGLPWIDMNQVIIDGGGVGVLISDGTHPNDAGQIVVAVAISSKLNELGW